MISSRKNHVFHRFLSVTAGTMVLLACTLLICGHCAGQEVATDAAAAASGDGGTLFAPTEVDTSAFSGIERGDSIGTATTQGFGLAGESTSGAAGGGGATGRGAGGLGGLGGLFGAAFGNAFGGQTSTSTQPTIRTRLRSAVTVTPRTPVQIQRSASRVLTSLPPSRRVSGVQVSVVSGTAVLTGNVQSERERRMSELLLRLEPGVRRVDNRLSVSP